MSGPHPARAEIPRGLQYVFTAFLAMLVPVYWREYGPANFLWFSDIALFAVVVGLWTLSPTAGQ